MQRRTLIGSLTATAVMNLSLPVRAQARHQDRVRLHRGHRLRVGLRSGVVIGLSSTARARLQPMLEFVRPLPASALLPLAIAIFGLSPAMVLAVVAFGAMWPVLLGTIHGLVAVEPRLQEVARCLYLSRAAYVWKWGAPFVRTAKKYGETHDAGLIWEGRKGGRDIGYCHLEKLHNLESLPPTGFTISCFRYKIRGASAGWTRAVAIFDDRLLAPA